MAKNYFILFISFFLLVKIQAQQTLKINKSVVSFFDSSGYFPVMTKIPFCGKGGNAFYLQYENTGSGLLDTLTAQLELFHSSYPGGATGVGLVYSQNLNLDPLLVGMSDTVLYEANSLVSVVGEFQAKFRIYDASATLLDSSSFSFEITSGDVYSKHRFNNASTGASFFTSAATNQPGGTTVGDQLATLFEIKNVLHQTQYVPSSITMTISNDISNIGLEVSPVIWEVNEHMLGTSGYIGAEVAGAFLPLTLSSSALGQDVTFRFDHGVAVTNGLSEGKYAVGYRMSNNPNGASLIVARDTITEALQFEKTSYVYFGHDTSWVQVDDLPAIDLVIENLATVCFVDVDEVENREAELSIYPNPSTGIFQLEGVEGIQQLRLYDLAGRGVLEQTMPSALLDISAFPNGVYFLEVQTESDQMISRKLIKH